MVRRVLQGDALAAFNHAAVDAGAETVGTFTTCINEVTTHVSQLVQNTFKYTSLKYSRFFEYFFKVKSIFLYFILVLRGFSTLDSQPALVHLPVYSIGNKIRKKTKRAKKIVRHSGI